MKLLAKAALASVMIGGSGLVSAKIDALDGRAESFNSVISSEACRGSCVTLLRDKSNIFLNVRDPETGDLFKLVPIDLTVNASFGLPKSVSSQPYDVQVGAAEADAASGGAHVNSFPGPPRGGTGTVVESSPFEDGTGWGEIQITYVFVNYRLSNVLVQRIYFRLMPK